MPAPAMADPGSHDTTDHLLPAARLPDLLDLIVREGYTPYGPQVRDGAIVIDRLDDAAALPWGWQDVQEAGRYRLVRRDDGAAFGFVHGADGWKALVHPPHVRLWRARRTADGFEVDLDPEAAPPLAFIGVRGCDLQAIHVLDRVLLGGDHVDATYAARRARNLVVAVDCAEPGGTCFCASMGTGPAASDGFDLALTELVADGPHRFVVRTGSARGADLVAKLRLGAADDASRAARSRQQETARGRMGRVLEPARARAVLAAGREHPHWDAVAARCLACGNCTAVCPTCFCTSVEDTTDVTATMASRTRRWESCFTLDFSYVVGGAVRTSGAARYRQWIGHKLDTWHDQFGTAGCVGCGRCITWCPVGIDLTAEVRALDAAR